MAKPFKNHDRGFTENGSRWKSGKTPSGKKYSAYRGSDGTRSTSIVHGKDALGYMNVGKKTTGSGEVTKTIGKYGPITGHAVEKLKIISTRKK